VFLLTFDSNQFDVVTKEYVQALNACGNQMEIEERLDKGDSLTIDINDIKLDVNRAKKKTMPLIVEIGEELEKSDSIVQLDDSEDQRLYSTRLDAESDIELSSLI
jgi:hypothetical protein